jgi:hypothetical protein
MQSEMTASGRADTFVFANDVDYAKPLIESGWNMDAIGTDATWFAAAAAKNLKKVTE